MGETDLSERCVNPQCRAELPPGAAVCAQCGAPQSAPVKLDYEAPAPEGIWRRIATTIRRLGPAGPLAVLASTMPAIGGFVLLWMIGFIETWMRNHRWPGLFFYVLGFTTLASLALLPTYACSILGGWVFGFGIGLPAAIVSFCGASLLGYWINSRAAGDRVLAILREHPRWEAIRKALIGSGFWKSLGIITLVRIPPSSPFAVTNFLMATTRAPLIPFLLGTAIGMTPRTAVVVWAAAHARNIWEAMDYKDAWIFGLGLVAMIAVVVVIGAIANRAVHQITVGGRQELTPPG